MSYSVKCDDRLLYKKYIEGHDLITTDFNQVDNEFGSFSFSFCDDHPLYNFIVPKKSKIKIYKNENLVWLGRAIEYKDDIDGERQVYCNGCLSFLEDSIMRPFDFNGSPEALFKIVIQQHNAQVSEDQAFVIGECTVTDPNDTIVRSSIYYLSTWTIFKEKLLNLGGHLVVTFDENERPVLNWYAEINNYSTQKIKLGENLVDFEKSLLYDDFYTACIPLGAKDDDGVRLTVDSVNDGKDYIVNQQLVDLYGIFYAPVSETTWEDVTLATNLLSKGTAWLNNTGIKYKDRVDLDAEDISFLPDVDVSDFYFLKNVQFVTASDSPLDYLVVDFSVDILDPYSVLIVLSNEQSKYMKTSLTDIANRTNAGNVEQIRQVESQVATKAGTESLVNEVIMNSTYISSEASRIVAGALQEFTQTGDFARMQQTVQSQFSILANEISMNFNTLSSQITQQGSDIQQVLNQYSAWFRFLSYGLVIGNSGSPIQMVLKNDVLYFCTDPDTVTPDTAIAYFSAGKLYVNFINVQNLTIGMTGRWLDIRIVGSGDNVCALFSGRLS